MVILQIMLSKQSLKDIGWFMQREKGQQWLIRQICFTLAILRNNNKICLNCYHIQPALLCCALCLRLQATHDYYGRFSCQGDGTTFHCRNSQGLIQGVINRQGNSLVFIGLPDFPLTRCDNQGFCWGIDGQPAAVADGNLTADSGHVYLVGQGNVQVG